MIAPSNITQLRPHAADSNARISAGQALDHVQAAIAGTCDAPARKIGSAFMAIARTRTHLHRAAAAAADAITLPVIANHVVQELCRAVWPELDDEAPSPLLGARSALRSAVTLIDRRDWLAAHRMLAVATAFLELAQEGLPNE